MGLTFGGCRPNNCLLSGQVLISLEVTESYDADYDTATAVCLAWEGAHGKGDTVQSVEGGVSTGYWTVEDVVTLVSGERTWRMRELSGRFEHLPWTTYKLRRKGYQQARASICRDLVPSGYPPRFCTPTFFLALSAALAKKVWAAMAAWGKDPTAENRRALDGAVAEQIAQMQGRLQVSGPEEIVREMCSWVGLEVAFQTGLSVMPDEYQPVNKSIITAVREVAAWSGASVLLDRNGRLVIFDWLVAFGAGAIPQPAAVLEEESHDALYPLTHVTVLGSGSPWAGAVRGTWDYTKEPPAWVPWDPLDSTTGAAGTGPAIEVTEAAYACAGDFPVEERIEIRDYPLTEELARGIARERLARVMLEAGTITRRGPAEGCQGTRPVAYRVFSVNRHLQWDGNKYKYEMEIAAPQADMIWGGSGDPIGNNTGRGR